MSEIDAVEKDDVVDLPNKVDVVVGRVEVVAECVLMLAVQVALVVLVRQVMLHVV